MAETLDDLIAERQRLEQQYVASRGADKNAARGLETIRKILETQYANQQGNDGYEWSDTGETSLDGGMFVKKPPVQWFGPSISTQGIPDKPVAPPINLALQERADLQALIAAGKPKSVGYTAEQAKNLLAPLHGQLDALATQREGIEKPTYRTSNLKSDFDKINALKRPEDAEVTDRDLKLIRAQNAPFASYKGGVGEHITDYYKNVATGTEAARDKNLKKSQDSFDRKQKMDLEGMMFADADRKSLNEGDQKKYDVAKDAWRDALNIYSNSASLAAGEQGIENTRVTNVNTQRKFNADQANEAEQYAAKAKVAMLQQGIKERDLALALKSINQRDGTTYDLSKNPPPPDKFLEAKRMLQGKNEPDAAVSEFEKNFASETAKLRAADPNATLMTRDEALARYMGNAKGMSK